MKYLVKDGQHLRLKPAGARCLRKGAREPCSSQISECEGYLAFATINSDQ